MNDYINRQVAIKEAEQMAEKHQYDFVGLLISLPSEDVQPVRHGRWIHDGFDTPHGVDWMHCSECGKRDKYCPAAMTNYCPNCGARMRKGEEV